MIESPWLQSVTIGAMSGPVVTVLLGLTNRHSHTISTGYCLIYFWEEGGGGCYKVTFHEIENNYRDFMFYFFICLD